MVTSSPFRISLGVFRYFEQFFSAAIIITYQHFAFCCYMWTNAILLSPCATSLQIVKTLSALPVVPGFAGDRETCASYRIVDF